MVIYTQRWLHSHHSFLVYTPWWKHGDVLREDAVQTEVQKLARGSWSSFKVKWGGNAKSQGRFKIKEDE